MLCDAMLHVQPTVHRRKSQPALCCLVIGCVKCLHCVLNTNNRSYCSTELVDTNILRLVVRAQICTLEHYRFLVYCIMRSAGACVGVCQRLWTKRQLTNNKSRILSIAFFILDYVSLY